MFDRIVPDALADAAMHHLRSSGVERGAIVAWLGHNSWDLLATLVACERLGAVLLPLNWRLAAGELAQIVAQAGAGHLIGTPEMAALAADVLAAAGALAPGAAAGIEADDLLLVYTSGTSGRPKGALHTRAGLRANAVAAIAAQRLDADTRVLSVLPLFHVGGLCIQTLPALAAGGKVLLQPRFDADAWFDAVAAWRPTTTLLVPALMHALTQHRRWPGADLSSLAFVNSGSQTVPLALIQAFHVRGVPVAQVYGCTESGPVSIALQPADAMAHPGMAGRPALGVQVRLAGGAGAGGGGGGGEILLRGANMMRGYHRASQPAFDADGWFHTGDLARLHADGYIEVVGRGSDVIISGGENIHPAEIESLVAGQPGVGDCAVVGVPDARWGEVPVLAVAAAAGQPPPDLAALRLHLLGQLARFKQPRRIVLVQALPKTALGKVQRSVLARQLAATAAPD